MNYRKSQIINAKREWGHAMGSGLVSCISGFNMLISLHGEAIKDRV